MDRIKLKKNEENIISPPILYNYSLRINLHETVIEIKNYRKSVMDGHRRKTDYGEWKSKIKIENKIWTNFFKNRF